jgi:hypothetical protein
MSSIASWVVAWLAILLLACGSESKQPALSTPSVPEASEPKTEKKPRVTDGTASSPAEEFQVEGPEINFNQPREISVIWKEMIGLRGQIVELFEQEKIKEIGTVVQRMLLLNRELLSAGRDFERNRQIELGRAVNIVEMRLNHVFDVAEIQIPGLLPIRLWEADMALISVEELVPEQLLEGSRYPRPPERPPV